MDYCRENNEAQSLMLLTTRCPTGIGISWENHTQI